MLRGAPTAILQSIAEGLRSCEQSTSFPKRVGQPPCNQCRTDPLKEFKWQVCVPENQWNPSFNHQSHPICYFNVCPTPLKSLVYLLASMESKEIIQLPSIKIDENNQSWSLNDVSVLNLLQTGCAFILLDSISAALPGSSSVNLQLKPR